MDEEDLKLRQQSKPSRNFTFQLVNPQVEVEEVGAVAYFSRDLTMERVVEQRKEAQAA